MAAAAGITEAALQAVTRRLHAAGARIVAGGDGGLGPAKPHGLLPRTLDEHARSGIPATAALAAATSVAADACHLAGRKGRIRPGHDADLLAVDGAGRSRCTSRRVGLRRSCFAGDGQGVARSRRHEPRSRPRTRRSPAAAGR